MSIICYFLYGAQILRVNNIGKMYSNKCRRVWDFSDQNARTNMRPMKTHVGYTTKVVYETVVHRYYLGAQFLLRIFMT